MLRKASTSEVMTWELQKTEQQMFENALGDEELEIERPDAISDDEGADGLVQESNEQEDDDIRGAMHKSRPQKRLWLIHQRAHFQQL